MKFKALLLMTLLLPLVFMGCTEDRGGGTRNDDGNNNPVENIAVPTSVTLDEGNSGSTTLPLIGTSIAETDIKHHWNMPAGTTRVVANLSWEGRERPP